MAAAVALSLQRQLTVYLVTLFAICMLCHGELARSRPGPRYLTAFYLTIATGGAIGGLFVAIAAPRIFSEYGEFPLGMAAGMPLRIRRLAPHRRIETMDHTQFLRPPSPHVPSARRPHCGRCLCHQSGPSRRRAFPQLLRHSPRGETFDINGPIRQLTHGSIRHGYQYQREPQRHWPTSYYGPHSGVGYAIAALDSGPRRIAVIGLGTGTLAAWGRAGDLYRFYEINPLVEAIAKTRFTYLSDSPARIEVVLGDARVSMDRELAAGAWHDYDLIAV